jgi:amino acid transporter
MLRRIASVIVGYLVIAVLTFVGILAAYGILGSDVAFRPGSFEVSGQWITVVLLLGLLAAILGGAVCAAIARGQRASWVLAALILVLGLVMALPTLSPRYDEEPTARDGELGVFEAMQVGRHPAWVSFANPFVGAVGVLIGSRRKRP